MSEEDAKKVVFDRHEALHDMMVKLVDGPIDLDKLKAEAKKNRVAIQINRGAQVWRTGDSLPEPDGLEKNATPLGQLYFSKVGTKYYVFTTSKGTTIAVTSQIANLIIYPSWLVYWPWAALFIVLFVSYKILNRQLKPISLAIDSVTQISHGNLAYRIVDHPKNDLGKLTLGINEMAESLEQLFASKNELLLSVSHELRSPMARMKVLLALLANNETVAKLNTEINKMDEIVEQLLESERLKDAHQLLNLETYFFPNVLRDILNSFESNDRIQLEGSVAEIAIDIDLGRFKFLIRNLIENALKHSGSESPVLVSTRTENSELFISVRDFGTGIEQSFISEIFEPFSQAADSSHRSNNGVGLGLFLCKRIAIAHGGALTVESELGRGSEFTFRLPIVV
ncbi:HAMP domain-containing sensor histidine kinase [Pseudoalteromonas byunsanensis]|nr:HAMP domain-containing sensor histidine kinase [Pseudoalteromonas byunsanensis]